MIPMITWQPCLQCREQMIGITDYAARDTCEGCGGEAKQDSAEAYRQRVLARKKAA